MHKTWCRNIAILAASLMLASCANKPALYKESRQLSFKPLWVKQVGKGTFHRHLNLQPTLNKQRLYVTSYLGTVSSYQAGKGGFLGKVLAKQNLTAPAVVDGKHMVVVSANGMVTVLDRTTGRQLWRKALAGEVLATPVLVKGLIILKTENDHVYALDWLSGNVRWHYQTESPSLILRGSGKPVVEGSNLLVGFANGELAKLDVHSGEVLWKSQVTFPKGITSIERMVDMDATPLVLSNRVYWANYQGAVGAYALDSGREIWQHPASVYAGLAADSNQLFVSDANQHVQAFDLETGELNWQQQGFDKHVILTAPVVYGDYVLLADQRGYLHGLNKLTGAPVSSIKLSADSGFTAAPLVQNKRIFMVADDGTTIALTVN